MLAPVVRGRKGEYDTLLQDLTAQGFVRARIDHEVVDIAEFLKRDEKLARYEQHTIEIVVDRLVRRDGIERRLTDSLETALKLADGVAEVEIVARDGEVEGETLTFSQHLACPKCGTSYDEPAPRNFSFNSPYGACETCDGLGTTFEVDPELVIPDTDHVDQRAAPSRRGARSNTQYFTRMLEAVAERLRHRSGQAVQVAHGQAAEGHPPRRRRQPEGEVQEPLRPHPRVLHRVRGRHPVAQPPPRGRRERLVPRAVRGLHARGAVHASAAARG